MADERPRRFAALVDAIGRAGLDALLLTSLPNIRYVTGFSGTSALALVRPGSVLFVTDFRYETQVAAEVGSMAHVRIEPQSLWSGLWTELGAGAGGGEYSGMETIGFESASTLHRDFQRLLDAGSRWQWRPVTDMVEALREKKDAGEVALIAAAAAVATGALESVLPDIRPGLRELDVAGRLERALREHGSEGFPFPTIVASGERSALPHARSSRRELRGGELLLLDFGAEVGGYCADITRTFVVGRASEEQRSVHAVVREANERASSGVRPGMRGRDADAIARGYIEGRGFGDLFGHSLGHGVGLEVHEAPRLARTAEGELVADSVVTIEPGIYRPGWGGVRIEDDVHLAAGGPLVLTQFTRDLLELV